MAHPANAQTIRLVCEECGATASLYARGWRGYLTIDDAVAIFCPSCSAREFDDGQRSHQ